MQQQPPPPPINPNPNPNPNPNLMAPPPPSTSPYYPPPSHYHPYYYYPPPDAAQPAALVPPVVDPTGAHHYFDPNQDWETREAVRHFGSDPGAFVGAYGQGVAVPTTGTVAIPSSGTEQFATTHLASTAFTNSIVRAYKSGANEKWPKKMNGIPSKKKMKVVQSAYCEVCKVDCTSKEELEKHKLGKKHKRKLENLRTQPQTVSSSSTLSGSGAPVIGPQEDPSKALIADGRKAKTKASETPEDLERKRRRVLEGGAAAEAVKTCLICNVVCNSETVLQYHLAGQKHIAALRKLCLLPLPTENVSNRGA